MSQLELPDDVNTRRRRNLFVYTILAMLAYQFSFGVIYLAKALGPSGYDFTAIKLCYLAFMACSMSALVMIRLKKQITKAYIFFILHYQSAVCILISAYIIYEMGDKRYLVLIGCQVILMFVFIQSKLIVSLLTILLTAIIYLSASYIGIYYSAQPGSFLNEVLYILIFVPVCVFIAYMSNKMQEQQKQIKEAGASLKKTHAELESHTERMMESIRYAELIQRSLLPGIERIKSISPDSMFIWMPKDIVGGDIFYTYSSPSYSIVCLMDCTGHGVPGAFLTMIVYSEIRKIIMDEACREPSDILKRLNRAVKHVLHNHYGNDADDGLDACICIIDPSNRKVTYAGARIALFYVKDGTLYREHGDKQSIGYKDSDDDYDFTNYVIDVGERCTFYMKTDGFTDQLGGEKRRRFGTDRFKQLIMAHHGLPFSEQRSIFLNALKTY
jgi:serine phosphatase RsbU (regulator of sigma subunit)